MLSNGNGITHEPNDDLIRRYVAGRLEKSEAEQLEEHYFGCDPCWSEVERAAAVRSAMGVAVEKQRSPMRTVWPALAAAAVAAFVFVGVWQMREGAPEREPVWRDSGRTTIATTVRQSEDTITVSWPPQPEARRYTFELYTDDGARVSTHLLLAPRITLGAEESRSGVRYRVIALDELGATVADSGLQPLR